MLITKLKLRGQKFYKQLPPGSFPLATIISVLYSELCLLKNILSLNKKIIYVPKFSKDLALAADNLCCYFKAKEKILHGNYAKNMFPLILISKLLGYHYVIGENIQKKWVRVSNLSSDVILHKVITVSSVITFPVHLCFILRKSKITKAYCYSDVFPNFFSEEH